MDDTRNGSCLAACPKPQCADLDRVIEDLQKQVEYLQAQWSRAENAHWADKQSRAWKMAMLLRSVRHHVAPRDGILFRSARKAVQSLRRLVGQTPEISTVTSEVAATTLSAAESLEKLLQQRRAERLQGMQEFPAYHVVHLPVIPWAFRHQRPQHLALQLNRRRHPGFYASFEFLPNGKYQLSPLLAGLDELKLPGPSGANVYRDTMSPADVARMVEAFADLRERRGMETAVVLVQLPYWSPLAEQLRERFDWPIVYDCMDDHAGFSTNGPAMLAAENRLLAEADLVVVTSQLLLDKIQSRARQTALIRNACEYEHFANVPWTSPKRRPVVGYYGAIADWFDDELMSSIAAARPEWDFQLIGSTLGANTSRLERMANVHLRGEIPYAQLPGQIADWDAFIIPFKRIPLTDATNPVKAYEMLATGKPVVAVPLPELRPIGADGLIELADTAEQFVHRLDRLVRENDPALRELRRQFAAGNTWAHRCDDLCTAMNESFPLASIVMLTYGQWAVTKMCLDSLFERTDYPNYEVIVVDNASPDETPARLREYAAREPRLKVICNEANRGFAAGNNQGVRAATGDFLCLLNNDTVLTHGWLTGLVGALKRDPKLGMVGPVSNAVGNEAIVPVDYEAIEAMPAWAMDYVMAHRGEAVSSPMLGFFCVAMRRKVWDEIGDLDEQFGIGYFEDDDYCHRVRARGYDLRFLRDVFVHHWQSASFKMLTTEQYKELFRANRAKFEQKWQTAWASPQAAVMDAEIAQEKPSDNPPPILVPALPAVDMARFVCVVCGTANELPRERLTREDGPCVKCGCYGRLRSIVWALTRHLSGRDVVLADLPADKNLRGLGCSDWGYVPFLEEKFNYVNTAYDREPRLDLKNPDWSRWRPESFDFITCTDVLEHVPAPVETAFASLFTLLKPGGVAILTVPTTLENRTREHFPILHDWHLAEEGDQRILIHRLADGRVERFTDLAFHGGDGLTLEFRVFARVDLIRVVEAAGFRIAAIHEQPVPEFGVVLAAHNIVIVAQKPSADAVGATSASRGNVPLAACPPVSPVQGQ